MQRLRLSCAQLVADGIDVKWLGGTFVPSDESLSCRFEGTAQAIRALHEIAGEPFDRIVAAVEVDDQ